MSKKMKKIYICHDFQGIYENVKKVVEYIKKLTTINQNCVYISPILLFGFLYDSDLSYDKQMEYCYTLLDECDLMITFGEESIGTGATLEKEYCKSHNIKIIDFSEYYKLNGAD